MLSWKGHPLCDSVYYQLPFTVKKKKKTNPELINSVVWGGVGESFWLLAPVNP